MSGSFTPGPWSVGRDSNYPASFGIIEGPSFRISYVLRATDVTFAMGEQRDRDARLIAAAPDLYEACLVAADVMERIDAELRSAWGDTEGETPELNAALDAARAALARARGETC